MGGWVDEWMDIWHRCREIYLPGVYNSVPGKAAESKIKYLSKLLNKCILDLRRKSNG